MQESFAGIYRHLEVQYNLITNMKKQIKTSENYYNITFCKVIWIYHFIFFQTYLIQSME